MDQIKYDLVVCLTTNNCPQSPSLISYLNFFRLIYWKWLWRDKRDLFFLAIIGRPPYRTGDTSFLEAWRTIVPTSQPSALPTDRVQSPTWRRRHPALICGRPIWLDAEALFTWDSDDRMDGSGWRPPTVFMGLASLIWLFNI